MRSRPLLAGKPRAIRRTPVHTPNLWRHLSRWHSRSALAAAAIVFVGTLIVALLQGAKPFYADSGLYWSLAGTFTRNGHFSLLNFESPVRGYALPLINYVLQAFAEGVSWSQSSVTKLFNVALFVLIGAVLAPRFAEITWPKQRWSVARRIALSTLLICFWSGYLNYPLSDFPGLALALLALVAISRPDRPNWMLLAGVCVGLAIDMRPAYLPLAPILVVIVALAWLNRRGVEHGSYHRRMICMGLLVAGFVGASLPQSLAAHRHYSTWSFIPGARSHLTEEQLTYGMALQRYDTFVDRDGGAFKIVYFDKTGARLLEEQPEEAIKSVSQYLGVVVDHPLPMAGLMARHVINGLDARYSSAYVEHLHSGGRIWLRLTGFLLVFLALVRVLWPTARRSLGPARWRYPVALSACCLTSVSSAMETRFMLPVNLLSYLLVLAPGWPKSISATAAGLRRFRILVILAIAYLVFMAVVWQVISGASGHVLAHHS